MKHRPKIHLENAHESKKQEHLERSYWCRWCGYSSDGTELSCPACGAPVNVEAITTEAGWTLLPPIKDMSVLQFGQSRCQIEGNFIPVADMSLSRDESVYFSHDTLLWMDRSITISARPVTNLVQQVFSGMPLMLMDAQGPGHIALSNDRPGEIIALPLDSEQSVYVREVVFLAASSQVSYGCYDSGIWYTTQQGETSWPIGRYIDHFYTNANPGLLLLHGAGNVFVKDLAEGQHILIKPSSLLFLDTSVEMKLHIELQRNHSTYETDYGRRGGRYLWLRLVGPGRVAVRSAFKEMEDSLYPITNSSSATRHAW